MGKITCNACGKVWTNGGEYMADTVKCGSDSCIHKSKGPEVHAARVAKVRDLFKGRAKEVHIRVSTDKVRPKIDPDKEATFYYDVPQVIVTEMVYH